MSKGGGQVQETSKERALAEVGVQQMQDFKTRWLPVQQRFAKSVTEAGAADSFQRRQAVSKAALDTTARFGQAADKLDATAAASGQLGSSKQKLGLTGLQSDRATSTGLAETAANSAVDDAYVSGLNAVTALGRGEKSTAIGGLQTSAALSGRQAAADADQALADRAGQYQLAGTLAGAAGYGYASRLRPAQPGLSGTLASGGSTVVLGAQDDGCITNPLAGP